MRKRLIQAVELELNGFCLFKSFKIFNLDYKLNNFFTFIFKNTLKISLETALLPAFIIFNKSQKLKNPSGIHRFLFLNI
jgi:hypothetical protein